MPLWMTFAFAAAAFQTLRFMLQKILSTARQSGSTSGAAANSGATANKNVTLSAAGATLSRFFYSAPLILLLLWGYVTLSEAQVPALSARFFLAASLGGLAQILATICVVALFKSRNFAVGITFKKTEVIQTALLGLVVLGDTVTLAGWGAIVLGLAAVLVLSKSKESAADRAQSGAVARLWQGLSTRASVLGLGSGVLFAVSAVGYRAASLQLETPDALLRAGVTLGVVVTLQTTMMLLWLLWRDRGEIGRVWQARRVAVWVGVTSMCGSFCWFVAFTLQNAAYVKALGQVELLLSLLASLIFFKEHVTRRELLGMGLLVLSILVLVLTL